jgi:uncharacterized OsmC-like protein
LVRDSEGAVVDQEHIAADVARAREYLRNLPALARYHDTPARATVDYALTVRVAGPEGMPIEVVAGIGDSAAVPSPGWYFRASLAASAAMFITMRAAEEAVLIEDLSVTVGAESDDRGALGMDEDIPAGPIGMTIDVRYGRSDHDEESTRSVIEWGVEHCTVYDAVIRPVPVELSIERSAPEEVPQEEVPQRS